MCLLIRAVADYVNRDLTNKVTSSDVYMTVGCNQGTEAVIHSLARPNANILLPRPSYAHFEARSIFSGLEFRKYDLLPEKEWEIDLQGIEAMADENTVSMVIITLTTLVEMSILMIISRSISKGWIVPGWRIGWIALNDPRGVLKSAGVAQSIQQNIDINPDVTTVFQFALPEILEKSTKETFAEKNLILKQNVELVCDRLRNIPCVVCIKKPESCTYLLAKLELPLMEDIEDDMDFCMKLAKEENLVLLPGVALGLKNWIRITIGVEAQMLEDALERLNGFCKRYMKKTKVSHQALKLNDDGEI
uniref:Aminotransferase class I/classII large domain-containing protein n=1 Tax=Brassica campestris TaxID=3711 RepID=M4D3H1_BRACM